MPDIPHFAYPFRFGSGGHADVVEQDSEEDIENCCLAILKCPLGYRIEQPDFGISEQALREEGADIAEIKAALEMWEERADYDLSSDRDAFDALVERVRVEIKLRSDD